MEPSFAKLILPSIAAVVLYVVTIAFYRLFLHPLSKFPGPRLAALTRYYEAYYDLVQDGQYTFKIAELHKIYGPIIRISPYELHVSDPAFYEKLYRQQGRWNKYSWSYDAFGVPHATICTSDHEHHRRRRAPLNSFFSKASVARRQELIQTKVESLCQRIDEQVESKTVFNLGTAFCAMTIDIATEFILGKSYDSLARPDFNQNMANMLQGSGGIWRTTKHFRFLDAMVKAMPLTWVEKLGNADMKEFMAYLRTTKAQTEQLMATIKPGSADDEDSTMIHAIIRNPNLPSEEKRIERVNDDVDTIVGAGLETVASVLRHIVFYLYRNPDQLELLRKELQNQPLDKASISQLEQLPYLTSVIMEGLRLVPGIATRMARIVPDRDLPYGNNWVIPARTPVGMTTLLMHLDPNLYPNPRTFDPQRWMDMEYRWKSEKTFAPFSRGTRICLGMQLAWAELYLTLATVVSRYNFQFINTTAEDVDAYSDQFIIGTKSKNGVRVVASFRHV